jgi:hypothetical protein
MEYWIKDFSILKIEIIFLTHLLLCAGKIAMKKGIVGGIFFLYRYFYDNSSIFF